MSFYLFYLVFLLYLTNPYLLSMHDTHLLKNILKYLDDQQAACGRIKKVHLAISEFGSLSKRHFLEHYQQAVSNTKWQDLEIEVKTIPFGPELEITGLEFAEETEAVKK